MKNLICNGLTIVLITSIFSIGCGKNSGFKAEEVMILDTGVDQNIGYDTPTPNGNTWDNVQFEGEPQDGTINKQIVVKVDKPNQSLILVLPIPSFVPMALCPTVQIPNLQGAFLTCYEDSSSGLPQVAVSVPLKHIIKGANIMPNQSLPNGDPLPYVTDGELPGFAIQFPQNPKYRFYLYIGTNIAAAFIEIPGLDFQLPFNLPLAKIKNKAKTQEIGVIGYISPKGAYDGGIYIATKIPNQMAAIIDDLIRW